MDQRFIDIWSNQKQMLQQSSEINYLIYDNNKEDWRIKDAPFRVNKLCQQKLKGKASSEMWKKECSLDMTETVLHI